MCPKKLFAVSLLAAAPTFATDSPVPASPDKGGCVQASDTSGMNEFTCPLKPSRAAVQYRFRVTFTGVHDDTRVSMEPTLNEQPLTCAEGSKTDFTGEEVGKSSLECRFTVPAGARSKPVLKVKMRWGHGDFAGVELIRE